MKTMKDEQRKHIVTLHGHAVYVKKVEGELYFCYARGDGTDYIFESFDEAVEHIEDCKKAEEVTQRKKEKAQTEAPNTEGYYEALARECGYADKEMREAALQADVIIASKDWELLNNGIESDYCWAEAYYNKNTKMIAEIEHDTEGVVRGVYLESTADEEQEPEEAPSEEKPSKIVNNITTTNIKGTDIIRKADEDEVFNGYRWRRFEYHGVKFDVNKEQGGKVRIDILKPSGDFTWSDWENSEGYAIRDRYSACDEVDLYQLMADLDEFDKSIKELNERAQTEDIDITEYVEACDREIAEAEELLGKASTVEWWTLNEYDLREVKKGYDKLKESIEHITARKEEVIEAQENGDKVTVRRRVNSYKSTGKVYDGYSFYHYTEAIR